jgi:hypothetical protein
MSYTLKNDVSAVPLNCNVGYNNSWIHVENNADRELFAQASYITNFSDINISLSASDLDIGSVHILDSDTGLKADVVPVGIGIGALRVISQDLESSEDDVTIGDRLGNFASVYAPLSALKVYNTNPISSVDITNIVTVKASNTFPISGSVTILNPITSVNVLNFPTQLSSVSITNQLTGITVLNPVTSVNVLNFPTQLSSVSITNQLTGITVLNPVTSVNVLNFPTQLSSVSILNPVTSVNVLNFPTQLSSVSILNPVTSVNVLNFPTQLTAVSITNQLTGITVLNPVTQVTTLPQPTQLDAFGRLRVSSPMTLFDSSHRYRDNNLWSTLSANGGSVSFNASQGLMDLNVTNTAGASAIRETTKVFSYQPGKSLLVMNTFVMASSATNLRQRVGYFGDRNGIYFQLDDGNISIVKRSIVTGSIVDSVVSRSNWNGDKLDGTGSSGLVLDITKAQIIWTDIEWLGVGTVRVGFCINGQFIVCHSFHHANIIDSTYITTASLPLRYEIINKAATTGGSKTLKQICSTVISEGGYELRGLQQAVSIPITTPRTFAVAGTFYPIITIRLKDSPDRLDGIVILTALSILGQGNGINYNWQVRASGVTTGGNWISAGDDSAVNYNITGTSYTGGRILASGFLNASNQASPNLDILKEALFKFQLERNNLTKTPFELTLVAATDTVNGSGMFASMDWEEVSR